MQRAARKVAQENERLRTLLARHGIMRDEVELFLRSCEQTEGSAEPETPTSNARSSSVLNPYPTNPGPRSLPLQRLSQPYQKDYSPRPSPIQIPRQPMQIPRNSVQISNKPTQESCSTSTCGPTTQCGPKTQEIHVEATIMARPVEACRQAESYYASPSETDSSPPPRSYDSYSATTQGNLPAFSYPERAPAIVQSQGCCPPPRPQTEVAMEDPDCPSTVDCFCPPTTTASVTFSKPLIGNDEISCETAATIIAQMRGDTDDAAARASLGCSPGQVCSIKNSFLMQVMDER